MFYWIFLGYLSQTRGMEGRGEFFFSAQPIFDDGKGVPEFEGTSVCSIMKPHEEEEVREERLAMLQKYYGRYFFKVFPNQASPSILTRLCQTYRPIYVERRNLWDQFLSLAISISSGIWSTRETFKLPEAKLEYHDCIGRLEGEVLAYQEIKKALPPGPTLIYEDFIQKMDLADLFSSTGLHEPFDPTRIRYPSKQNEGPDWKLARFRDPEALISTYRNSALNSQFPV